MSTTEQKKKILAAGLAKMEEVVSDFQSRVDELKTETTEGASEESASQTEARKDADLEMLENLNNQLSFARQELDTLRSIDPKLTHEKVEFGSVVITDKRNLFVSTGIEDFSCDGKDYFGLSTQAPLFKNMAGSAAGDKVSFHGIEYQIQEVF